MNPGINESLKLKYTIQCAISLSLNHCLAHLSNVEHPSGFHCPLLSTLERWAFLTRSPCHGGCMFVCVPFYFEYSYHLFLLFCHSFVIVLLMPSSSLQNTAGILFHFQFPFLVPRVYFVIQGERSIYAFILNNIWLLLLINFNVIPTALSSLVSLVPAFMHPRQCHHHSLTLTLFFSLSIFFSHSFIFLSQNAHISLAIVRQLERFSLSHCLRRFEGNAMEMTEKY